MTDQHLPAAAAEILPTATVTPIREPAEVVGGCSCELPSVQVALARAIAEVQAVGKDGQMSQDAGGYRYRRVDDLVDACSDALANHGVIVIPHVAHRTRERVNSQSHVDIEMHLEVVGPRGDHFTFTGFGEGMDRRDRATAKAGTDAWKFALLRLLMVRVSDRNDSETRNSDPRQPTGDPLDQPLVRVAIHAARLVGRGLITETMQAEAITYARKGEAHLGQIVDRLHDIETQADDPGDDDQGDDEPGDGPEGGAPEGGSPTPQGGSPANPTDPPAGEPSSPDGAPAAAAAAHQSPHPSAGDQVNPGSDGRADRFHREPEPASGSLLEPPAATVARRTPTGSPAADQVERAPRVGPIDSDGFTADERTRITDAGIEARQLSDLAHIVTAGMTSAVRTLAPREREQLLRIADRIATGDAAIARRTLVDPRGDDIDPWRLP